MKSPEEKQLRRLKDRLGYSFVDDARLRQALTHRSASSHHNERLEFLGDAVLELAISGYLYQQFPTLDEGRLSRFRAQLVKKQSLADKARSLKIGQHLRLGQGERSSGGFDRDSILADSLEAILGAIYLEAGFETATASVFSWFEVELNNLATDQVHKDPKTRLQELLQAEGLPLPEYKVIGIEGKEHEQTFSVECVCRLVDEPVSANGDSIKQAEQQAAATILGRLDVD